MQRHVWLLGLSVRAALYLIVPLLGAVAWTIVLFALVGCMRAAPRTEPATATPGIPLSVWTAPSLYDNGYGCQPEFIRPSTLCVVDHEAVAPVYNCTWRCPSALRGERQ